ncbi:MAG TPA: hypothetical protein VLG46_17040, partial [Anaerolineae bacterium]|nr:hypothetical protein [Anaerolineae bacterium]
MKADTMATRLIDSSAAHQRFIRKAGILYGVNVALGFTLFFWLPDALALRELHYAGWWMKLVLGLALVTPLSAALGWLAASLRWAGLSVLAWMAGGGMLAWIGGHVQFEGMSWLMRLTDIYPSEQVMYPFTLAATAYTGLSAFVGVGVGLFIGTFGLLVLERAWEASTQRHGFSFKSLVILGACLPALLGLGLIADFQINV